MMFVIFVYNNTFFSMKIFARGEKIRTSELQQKLESTPIEWTISDNQSFDNANLSGFDLIFDLNFDEHQNALSYYAPLKGKPVVVSSVKKSLAMSVHEYGKAVDCVLVGINALPTFINRGLAELSVYKSFDHETVSAIFSRLNWEHKIVNDRVGFITPRVILMIINEACYTLQEGTAGTSDIDTSMKLGTNYPFGPFEWAEKIGIKHVYETLEAVYQDTHDERYKICPLLKTLYLTNGSFYQ
jgi:3-hydroxybutyryl-CoA dehydrogenase